MDIAEWLRRLGLGQYAPAFAQNDIDEDVLLSLQADDLRELGVVSIGHRRRLLDAIAALRQPGSAVEPAAPAAMPTVEAERRQLTIMFCDLVGSTALSARFDPEDLRELIGAYHRCVSATVTCFDGFVAKYMGDGVLVYFGYPQAHEDDAERAVRAGLTLIDAVGRLNSPEPLQVRLGIASGLVVVGDLIGEGAAQERGVVGETPNLSARLQALAAPGTLVIADATRRQIGGLFELEDLGPQKLAGFAVPQHAWRIVAESGIVSRFEALRSGTTPLVGRDEELELLERRWRQAKGGEGRVALISGEPGIGKSRLIAELARRIGIEPHTRLRYFCAPHHQNSALYPFIVQLERAAGFGREDRPEDRRDKLEALLAPAARDSEEIELLAELLSLPNFTAELNLSPQRKREKLFEALLNQLEALTEQRPVLMLFEDAHWIDPTSRELVDLAVGRVARLPILLVLTFRPEFQPPWAGQPHVTSLALNRLGQRQVASLVLGLAGNTPLGSEIVSEIVERTDGVPLFVEELTKAVLERANQDTRVATVLSASPLPALAVPATLHALLIARLDSIGAAAKELAQIGAVLGREFGYELIRLVAQRPEPQLQSGLAQLTEAGLLFCRGAPPHASYLFKHALVQDAAYGTLLRGRRQELHARVAAVLERDFADLVERQPELLAHHLTAAGEVQKSVVCWSKAGRRAMARSAMVEAAAQLQKGLDQLELLPEDSERHRQELELTSVLGTVMQVVKGTGAPERGPIFARARKLWEKLDYPLEFLHVPHGEAIYHAYCGELATALRLGEELLQLSRQRNEVTGLIFAHQALGLFLMLAGRFNEARSLLEPIPGLYELLPEHSLIFRPGNDRKALAEAILGNVLFFLGFPEQALACTNNAIAEAERLAHGLISSGTFGFALRLLSVYGDNSALSERADQQHKLTTEQGFPSFRAEATMYRGWVMVKNGEVEEGIGLLRQGATEFRAVSPETAMSYYLYLLAQALAMAGRIDEAFPLIDDALRIVEATGEARFAAEMNRHKGEFLLQKGVPEAAETLYRKAIGIAREQQAKLWELRATMSLARLWRDQGRPAEARDLLAPVYVWFTEGFETTDLKAAKALLEEIG